MGQPEYAFDKTFCSAALLRALAEEYGTPLLVYDRETWLGRVKLLKEAFSWAPGFRQFFPVKAAANPALWRLALQAGCGLLCSSEVELSLAAQAGGTGQSLLFTSCFPGREDWEAVRKTGAQVILDSPSQLAEAPLPEGKTLGLRLKYHHGSGKRALWSRFGMDREQLLDAAILASRRGATSLGLHVHRTGLYRPGEWCSSAEAIFGLVEEVQEAAGLPVAWCDLGGGLLWDQKEAYTLDLPKEAAAIREAFERTVPAAGREQMEIRTQLGRFLAAPCGLLLATVRGVKDSWVGVDASMADLPRACLAGVQYHVSLLGSIGLQGRSSRFLSGRSTDSLDHFGRRLLPPVSPGDILVFHGAGAYSRSMASNYGGSLRCPEILLEDGVPRLIRRREVVEDLLPGLL